MASSESVRIPQSWASRGNRLCRIFQWSADAAQHSCVLPGSYDFAAANALLSSAPVVQFVHLKGSPTQRVRCRLGPRSPSKTDGVNCKSPSQTSNLTSYARRIELTSKPSILCLVESTAISMWRCTGGKDDPFAAVKAHRSLRRHPRHAMA